MKAAKEKTWINSMFSQHSNLGNSNSAKRKTCDVGTSNTMKRTKKTTDVETDEDCNDVEVPGTSLLNKMSADAQTPNDNWVEFIAPKCSHELAIHPKKRQELEHWFQHCLLLKKKNPAQLCLLTGPSGSGKTTAVRVLSKEHNISIQEWINPVDQDNVYNLGDQTHVFTTSQIDAFKNFLFKASRYRSLLEANNSNKCLLLVEDFPNFILKEPTLLQEILEDYVTYAKSPLIFIVTDAKTRGLNISYNIFTDQIKQKFLINHISFNPVASTLMQKSMKRFCNLMRSPSHCQVYKPPLPDILDSIVLSAQGDIRNAFINLHFSSLRGAPNVLTRLLKNEEATNTSKKKKMGCKLKSLGRDESVTMMHALGRVFNPKFTESKRFVNSPEDLAESFTTEPKKFIDLVETNYLQHFREIEYVLEAADGLSICDVMLNEYRDDSMALIGLNVGIRSMMVANLNPATGWMPIKGQKRFDYCKAKVLARESKLLPQPHNISSRLYKLDYKTFVNTIENKN